MHGADCKQSSESMTILKASLRYIVKVMHVDTLLEYLLQ